MVEVDENEFCRVTLRPLIVKPHADREVKNMTGDRRHTPWGTELLAVDSSLYFVDR